MCYFHGTTENTENHDVSGKDTQIKVRHGPHCTDEDMGRGWGAWPAGRPSWVRPQQSDFCGS